MMLLDQISPQTAGSPPTAVPPEPRIVCLTIAVCVALDFSLDPSSLFARGRGAPRLAQARQIAMYLAHVGFALGCETVGRQFRRDRSTVAHACRAVEDGRDDRWFDCRVSALELVCRGALFEAERVLGAKETAR